MSEFTAWCKTLLAGNVFTIGIVNDASRLCWAQKQNQMEIKWMPLHHTWFM